MRARAGLLAPGVERDARGPLPTQGRRARGRGYPWCTACRPTPDPSPSPSTSPDAPFPLTTDPDPLSKPKPGRVLEAEGVRLVRATADAVGLVPGSNSGAHTLVCIAPGGAVVEVEGDTLLVATGRRYLLGTNTDYSLLTTDRAGMHLLTTYHLPPTTCHLPLATYHLPPTTYHLPTTHHPPPTTHHLPQAVGGRAGPRGRGHRDRAAERRDQGETPSCAH